MVDRHDSLEELAVGDTLFKRTLEGPVDQDLHQTVRHFRQLDYPSDSTVVIYLVWSRIINRGVLLSGQEDELMALGGV